MNQIPFFRPVAKTGVLGAPARYLLGSMEKGMPQNKTIGEE
jgi:hypothetical protein